MNRKEKIKKIVEAEYETLFGEEGLTCCLCATTIDGMGHNPEPLGDGDDRACDTCNSTKVIVARLNLLKGTAQ